MVGLSPKQAEFVKQVVYGSERRFVAHGAVRSGKTLAGVLALARLARAYPGLYLLCAPTMAQVRGVLLATLSLLYGDSLVVRAGEKRAYLGSAEFALYSGNDEGSELALRGLTARGALVDDAVGVPDSFLQQVVRRCSASPRKVVLLTNPDSPYHPIKTAWIDRADGDATLYALQFDLADNPALPPDYGDDLDATLSGAMLRRMRHGEWALAAGSTNRPLDAERGA